jgi:vesicle-associated membrane protein 7
LILFRLHGQVQEVVGVMKKNIDKLLDRDVALSNLMTRADDLESSATTYNQTTKQLRRKFWWKNAKVKLLSLFILAVIVLYRQMSALLVLSSGLF